MALRDDRTPRPAATAGMSSDASLGASPDAFAGASPEPRRAMPHAGTAGEAIPDLDLAPASAARPRPASGAPGAHPAPKAVPGTPAGRPAPQRPDPRPMRFALAAGGVAALSALLATISASAIPTSAAVVTIQKDSPADAAVVQNVTRVVKLPPGVAAPANAGPNVLVTQLPAPIAKPKTVVVTTTQSGRVVKP
jgi:hypothetical protein